MHIAHNRYFGDDKTGLIIEAQIDGVDTHRIHVALCKEPVEPIRGGTSVKVTDLGGAVRYGAFCTPFRIESVKVVHGDD